MFKYTVVIPHYNDLERLIKLLKTIPVERGDIQVLVVDDCSSDHLSLSDIRELFPSVTWLSTKNNKGAARNVGMEHSEGDWLIFSDSDDEFMDDAFDIFDKNVGDDVDLVYFLAEGYNDITGSESYRAERFNDLVLWHLDEQSSCSLMNLKQRHVVPWAKMYRRECTKGFLFDEVMVGNDVAFNVLVALSCQSVRVVPEVVYTVTKRSGSLTTRKKSENFIARVKVSALLSNRVIAAGYRPLQSGTGFLLESLSYGPLTLLKSIYIISRSSLSVDVLKLFQISRWKRFFYLKRQN